MNRSRAIVFVSAALAIVAGAVATARPAPSRPARTRHDIVAERVLRDSDIAFYRRHAARDPTGALDHLHLAGLYLQRARERSAPADLVRAEAEARLSLANRRAHNSEAWHELALALVGQHKFIEARQWAESLLAVDPSAPGPRSQVGEIDLATTALPEEVVRRVQAAGFKAVPTGIEHGTVTVVIDGRPFEVTTLRRGKV